MKPHLLYIAIGFPPAAKSCAYRMRTTAALMVEHGWDVTVMTLPDEAWEREFGTDPTLMAGVPDSLSYEYLPLAREDLEADIRRYPRERAIDPAKWLKQARARDLEEFPELVFGSWRPAIEKAALELADRRPIDLVVVSPAPNTAMAAALALHRRDGTPYVLDYRDAWSLNVLTGAEAFPRNSEAGRWESDLFASAAEVWCVNDTIAQFYRDRYPDGPQIYSVENGYDPFEGDLGEPSGSAESGLTFGYLGTSSFQVGVLERVLKGWALAQASSEVMARSALTFWGHFGAGVAQGANRRTSLIGEYADHGVRLGGPVPKAKVGTVYESCDVLVHLQPGGRYVTGGKTYELAATGRVVLSLHAKEHGASEVLRDHPMWVAPPDRNEPELIAERFVLAAERALTATRQDRISAQTFAQRYERRQTLGPAVARLTAFQPGEGTTR